MTLTTAIESALARANANGLTLDELEAISVHAEPSFATAPDRRQRLADALETLRSRGVLRFPTGKAHWDRAGEPVLPAWVRPPAGARAKGPAKTVSLPADLRPELAGARTFEPLSPSEIETLDAVNSWLVHRSPATLVVPHRERSLQVFGNEKRLDVLRNTRLFTPGVLSFELLSCEWIPPQLAWTRTSSSPVALAVENAATYYSLVQVLRGDPGPVGVVAYGGGNAFTKMVAGLSDPAVGPVSRLLYFGDLDATGLEIPQRTAAEARRCGLPAPEPALGLYRLLLAHGSPQHTPPVGADRAHKCSSWLGPLASDAEQMLINGYWIAQEAVGLELLASAAVAYE